MEDLEAALKDAKGSDGPAVVCLKTNHDANLAIPLDLGLPFAELYQGPMG
jgi:acetolactate synthase I/II/III large subunit